MAYGGSHGWQCVYIYTHTNLKSDKYIKKQHKTKTHNIYLSLNVMWLSSHNNRAILKTHWLIAKQILILIIKRGISFIFLSWHFQINIWQSFRLILPPHYYFLQFFNQNSFLVSEAPPFPFIETPWDDVPSWPSPFSTCFLLLSIKLLIYK